MPLRVIKIETGTYDGQRFVENPTRFEKCVASVSARGGAYDPKAVCAVAGRKKYGKKKFAKMAAAGRKRAAKKNPLSYALVQAADGAGYHSGQNWPTGRPPSSTAIGREFRDWLAYRRGSMPEIQTLTASDKQQLRGAFFRAVRRGYKPNPRRTKKRALRGKRK